MKRFPPAWSARGQASDFPLIGSASRGRVGGRSRKNMVAGFALIGAVAALSVMQASSVMGAPAPLPDKDAVVQTGVPLWAATAQKPMVIYVKQKDPANPAKTITKKVTIDNLPQFTYVYPAFVPPTRMPGETYAAFRQRYQTEAKAYVQERQTTYLTKQKAAWEAASKAKTDTIRDQINTQIGPGTATSDTFVNQAGFTQGRFTISNCLGWSYGKGTNTTGEVGDGTTYKDSAGGSGGGGSSYQGSMGSVMPGGPTAVATGFDPSGGPSEVDFGVTNTYIASDFPLPGDTVDTVLMALASDLNSNGLPAVYDPGKEVLSLTATGANSVFFSMSDPGLDGSLGVTVDVVPEPASLLALGLGICGLGAALWRSAAVRGAL